MRKNTEAVLEAYMWGKIKNRKRVSTSDCLHKIEQEFRIKITQRCTIERLGKLILRVRNRLKKRNAVYQKNLEMFQSKANCPLSLLIQWEDAGLIDFTKNKKCAEMVQMILERDFVLAHDLSEDQIPTDPNVPTDKFIPKLNISDD